MNSATVTWFDQWWFKIWGPNELLFLSLIDLIWSLHFWGSNHFEPFVNQKTPSSVEINATKLCTSAAGHGDIRGAAGNVEGLACEMWMDLSNSPVALVWACFFATSVRSSLWESTGWFFVGSTSTSLKGGSSYWKDTSSQRGTADEHEKMFCRICQNKNERFTHTSIN